MKFIDHLHVFLLAVLTVGLASCKDDAEKENRAKLEGSWIAIELLLSDCDDPDMDMNRALECTSQECIKYTFSIDTAKNQVYVKSYKANGVTESEVGTFSVGESSLSFCQDNEGEVTCTKSSMSVSKTSLTLTTGLPDSGCTEVLRFEKEETDES